ncbi:MAG: cephalosporin hydroxylase family protein [Burkholderiales bacterium]|nr:cephalosporin hydroxylase family protein [Burkholderiales bacterium]
MSSNPIEQFAQERSAQIAGYAKDAAFTAQSQAWLETSMRQRYVYNFDWMGRPIIQYPQDMVAMQELVWATRPDLIIETGIAHGGSLVLSASLLAMLDYCDTVAAGGVLDPKASRRKVLGLDIDIRAHNRAAIEAHPMAHKIEMIQGSSISPEVIAQVQAVARQHQRVMVCLDSNHTHAHVLAELQAYAPLTSVGCYCVVFDTFVEDMPVDLFPDRPWAPGDNPKTAVREYLKTNSQFEVDTTIPHKLQVTVAPDGFLRRAA